MQFHFVDIVNTVYMGELCAVANHEVTYDPPSQPARFQLVGVIRGQLKWGRVSATISNAAPRAGVL